MLTSAVLGAWLRGLAARPGLWRSSARAFLEWAAFASFSGLLLRRALPLPAAAGQLPALVSAPADLADVLACVAAGAAAFGLCGGLRDILRGAGCGLCWGALASFARVWMALAAALSLAGFFAGAFLAASMPVWLAAAAALTAFASCHVEARRVRARIVTGVLLVAALPAALLLWHLRAGWDYGPRSLFEAAGVSRGGASGFSVAWLRPRGGQPYEVQPILASGPVADLSYESLGALYRYLERRRGRSLFAAQALAALRAGWLAWWDPDRALEADLLSYPGRSHPDYLGGLTLIRAGPLTPERYAKLSAFDDESRKSSAGFEDVNRSQLIFEAFSAAYARFGDEQKAREWLLRVDNLWPIYDKKVEVSPIESFRGGAVSGSLFEGRSPAAGVRVGLFYVATSSGSAGAAPISLSQSAFPGSDGRFRFTNLGAGRYYLALLARAGSLTGRILGAPGVIELTAEAPQAQLEPIRIEP